MEKVNLYGKIGIAKTIWKIKKGFNEKIVVDNNTDLRKEICHSNVLIQESTPRY